MHLSLPKRFPLFILASSVCKSLQCLIYTLTQGYRGGHLFRLTCSVVLWGRKNTANKYHWHVWHKARVLTVSGHTGIAPSHGMCAFPVYTAHAPGCSTGELSKASPGLYALPRSKPLRFGFLDIPQRHRLGSACVLCPSQALTSQATRCLASTLSPDGAMHLITAPPSQVLSFLGAQQEHHLKCAVYLLWGADLWLRPSWQMSTIPGKLG